jgi:hypothetical protein
MVRPRLLVVLCAVLLAGCGGSGRSAQDEAQPGLGPRETREPATPEQAAQDLGVPALATKNTTRIAGRDAVAIAAGAARAVFPGVTPASRPGAVVLAPQDDWRAAVAASVLMAEPVRAPLLLTGPDELPDATRAALDALRPAGARALGGAQVVRVGAVAEPAGLRARDVRGRGPSPYAMAQAIDALARGAAGGPSDQVLVVSADAPAYAMPAAGWAAKSGDPVLFVERDRVPPETAAALRAHRQPRIYVLGPGRAVSSHVVRELRRFGTVQRVSAREPVANAIAFARYADGRFGWGIVDPGHGLVLAASEDPLVAAGASPLSATGKYGPLLLTGGRGGLARELQEFLLDIQPGFQRDPVRGVYNHGWVLGDEAAVSLEAQARLDGLLEIVPVNPEDPGAGPATTTATTPTTTTP